MATNPITSQNAPGTKDYDGLTLSFTAVDSGVDNNSFVSTGRELVVLLNDTVGAINVTFTSTNDLLDRTKDMVVSVPADAGGINGIALAGPFKQDGWIDTNRNIIMQAASAGVRAAVVVLPAVT